MFQSLKKKNNKITLFITPLESQSDPYQPQKNFLKFLFSCALMILNSKRKYCTFATHHYRLINKQQKYRFYQDYNALM